MPNRAAALFAVSLCGLLAACAGSPPEPAAQATTGEVPELTLNLPGENCSCDEAPEEGLDRTFLDRGFIALYQGDHIEAVQYFQRYQRLEKAPQADWETAVAISFLGTLPSSPFFAPDEARKTYRTLRKDRDANWNVHPQVDLVSDAMDMFLENMRYTRELEDRVEVLEEDLEKKEEALKRLRELTLGQRGAQR